PLAPTWGSVARLCEPTKGIVAQCDADKAIAPQTKLPYQPGNYCILTTIADAECPPTYPRKKVFYDPAQSVDTRACGSCSCAPPKGNCAGQVHGADTAAGCGGGEDFIAVAQTGCVDVKKSPAFAYEPGSTTGVDPKCDPNNEGPKGSFVPTAPTTICC